MGSLSRALLIRIALLLASTLFSLMIAEGIVRLVAPQRVLVPLEDEIKGIATSRPNVRGRQVIPKTFDVTVSTNSQRFRSRKEFAREPAPGAVRIAALGDSFTFGWGANDDETYPAQLERTLANFLRPGRVEVINAGVSDTGTGEEALFYDVWVRQFHPHVVILNVVSNDVDDDLFWGFFYLDPNGNAVPRSEEQRRLARRRLLWIRGMVNAVPGYTFLAQHSQFLNLLRYAIWWRLKGGPEAAAARKATSSPLPNTPQDQARKAGLRLMAAEVTWLRERVRDSGARLVVVFLPGRESAYASTEPWVAEYRRRSNAMVQVLKDVCFRESIPFLDLTPQVQRRAERDQRPLYFHRYDDHPTPVGYRAFAEAVAQFLVEERMLSN